MRYQIQKQLLFAFGLFVASFFTLASLLAPRVSADPTKATITCYDQKGGTHTVTAKRAGSAFTTKDYQDACKAQGFVYQDPNSDTTPTGGAPADATGCNPLQNDPATDQNGTATGGSCTYSIQKGDCSDLSKCDVIMTYVNPFIKFLSAFVGVAVVASVIIGGIQYSSAGADSSKITAAKNRIRNAIIALVTYIFLFALLNFLIPGGIV